MKNLLDSFSSSTNKQAYIFTFLILLVLVPTIEITIGNSGSPFSANALAVYVGSIFTLWTVPALAIRFISAKWGYIIFVVFTTLWALGANTTRSNKEVQSSIAKSAGEILVLCGTNKHLQTNYCTDFKFNEEVTNACKTDIALLAPNDMQAELRKALSNAESKKMIANLESQMDQKINEAKQSPNYSIEAMCSQFDQFTHSAYTNAINSIAIQKNK